MRSRRRSQACRPRSRWPTNSPRNCRISAWRTTCLSADNRARVAMYEFAYNEVIEDSRQTMRARERQAMDRVIAMLRAAGEKGPGSRERIEALFYLCRLWMIFLNDLNDPSNELPDQLRGGIISIGIWMMKEIERVRSGQTDDLTPMIEINQLIRDGLK